MKSLELMKEGYRKRYEVRGKAEKKEREKRAKVEDLNEVELRHPHLMMVRGYNALDSANKTPTVTLNPNGEE